MKKNIQSSVKLLSSLIFLFFISSSCCPKIINLSGKKDFEPDLERVKSVVIRVDENFTNSQTPHDLAIKRLMKEADSILECPCSSSNGKQLKLLKFDFLDQLKIESKVGAIPPKHGSQRQGGANVNFEFNTINQFDDFTDNDLKYTIPVVYTMENNNYVGFSTFDLDSIPGLSTILDKFLNDIKIEDLLLDEEENRPIIAVLDTGLDPIPFKSSGPFLQNTKNLQGNCSTTNNMHFSGWNFVNNNNNVFDDNSHGTFVTKIMKDKLDDANTEHSILPLKVLDKDGKGTYWNILCALSYLSNIQKSTGNLRIINTSFGGIMDKEEQASAISIYEDLLVDLGQTINVASAGNKGENNDAIKKYHFPSNSGKEIMLAVGGYLNSNEKFFIHPDSNRGPLNVDVATIFDGYRLKYKKNLRRVRVTGIQGTSYSAAYISAVLLGYIEAQPNTAISDIVPLFLESETNQTEGLSNHIKNGYYIEN